MLSVSQPVVHKAYEPVNKIYAIFLSELKAQEQMNPTCYVRSGSAQGTRQLLYGDIWACSIQHRFRSPSQNNEPRTPDVAVSDKKSRKIGLWCSVRHYIASRRFG